MSINRRAFLLMCVPGLLAACQSTTNPTEVAQKPPVAAVKQSTAASDVNLSGITSSDVSIVDVDIEFAPHIARTDRDFDHPREEVLRIVREAMTHELTGANTGGAVQATAKVTILSVFIANVGTGVLLGSSSSTIRAKTTLVEATSGGQIGESVIVGGAAGVRPTIIGAAAIKSPEEEVKLAAASLASRTKKQIYK